MQPTSFASHCAKNLCCSTVIMSGVNGNVIMSGCGDDHPDDERQEAVRDNTKSVSRGADGGRGGNGSRSLRAAVLPDQSAGEPTRGEGSHPWQPGTTWSLPVQLGKKPQPS